MPPNRFALLDLFPTFEKARMNNVSQKDVMTRIWKTVIDDSNIEGVFNMMFASKRFSDRYDIDEMTHFKTDKIIFMWMVGDTEGILHISRLLNRNHIGTFTSIEEMIKNFSILLQESKNKHIP
jgi:hypothetical protein